MPELKNEIDALNEKAWNLESINPQSGMRLSKETFKLSTSGSFQVNVYKKGMADSLFNQAHFNLSFGDYQLALSQSLEALSIYTDLKESARQAQSMCVMGAIYLSLNEYNKAMGTLVKAMEIARHLNHELPLGEILLTMGMVFLYAGDTSRAILEIKRSLQIFQQTNQLKLSAYAFCNLAAAYKSENEIDIFRQYLERCEKVAVQIGSDLIMIDVLRQKGQFELQSGNLEKAQELFQQSLKLADTHGYKADQVSSSLWMSDVFFKWGKLDAAIALLVEALNKSRKNRFTEGSLHAHQKLALIYEQQKEYQQAYEHLKAYIDLELKFTSEKNDLKYQSLETIYHAHSVQQEARILQNQYDQLEKEISDRRFAEEALKQSEDKFRRLANLDPVTGLNNRRYFYSLALNEFKRISRYFHPLTVMMINVDNFIKINDQFGHLLGDQILKMVGRQLETFLREVDILGRYGGVEFVVLMPETTLDQSVPVANRLLSLFSDKSFEIRDETVQITISIGIASFEANISLDRLIERADRALQVAKNAGTNRISIWEDSMDVLPLK
ncbi:MAG: tetratricopeptide repeat-containing diguanylate cyclase [Anaerolineaceae bacterium]